MLRCGFAALFLSSMLAFSANAQPPTGKLELSDDETRSQLAEYEMFEFAAPAEKAARRAFLFPGDAQDGIYGFDISHHNHPVDWLRIKGKSAKFIYIKSSQGIRYVDSRFKLHWDSAAAAGLRRGAYHFLSARISGKAQAANFIEQIESVGGLQPDDLAPVMDLEWDMQTVNGARVDAWSQFSATQIVAIASEFLEEVEKATGRRPVIYTAASWWKPRLGTSPELLKWKHWIADYRLSSINNQAPVDVPGSTVVAWQFTDVGSFSGSPKKFDVNQLSATSLDELSGK